MPKVDLYQNYVVRIQLENKDIKIVYELSDKWMLTVKEVCHFIYLLLIEQYTGVLSYKIYLENGNSYLYTFREDRTIGENIANFTKIIKYLEKPELFLQECRSVKREYTFWVENTQESIIISINLKNIVSIIPPYLEQHVKYCLNVLYNGQMIMHDMNLIIGSEKILIEQFQNSCRQSEHEPLMGTINEKFSEIVSIRSLEPAIEMQGNSVTYLELDFFSNQVANILQKKGVERKSVVGVMMGTDIDLIIWILGIIKLQATYMPIDSENSIEYVGHMIEECNVKYIVGANAEVKEHFSNVYFLDKHIYMNSAVDKFNIKSKGDGDDNAYIIYTSGSTEKPRGIAISHNNLLHQVDSLQKWGGFPPYASVLLAAHYCFDVSIQQIFFPLLSGGKIYILPERIKLNGRKVVQYINDRDIDIVNFVPSYLEVLLQMSKEKMKCKILLIGGEIFRKHMLTLIREKVDAKVICNIYGPSEATINTTIHMCDLKKYYETIPIGKPLLHYRTYVINCQNKKVPIGVNGELCISGPGVAKGYINHKELTEKKFVIIENIDSSKVFKSGDYVSWNSEGELFYIGRKDFQIKINGKRVEIEAIESIMYSFDKIKMVAVIFCEGKNRLIAYFTASEVIEKENIKQYLSERCASYMIPTYFIQINAMPLTDSGKIDRKLLKDMWKKEGNLDG